MSSEHQFKVGDKVRVKSTVFTEAMGMAGKIGTVTNVNPLWTQVLQVSFDDGSYGSAGFFASSSLEPFTLDLSTTVTPDNIHMVVDSSMWKPKKCLKGHVSDMAISAVYGAEFKPPICPKCFAEFLAAALKDVGRVFEEE